jgi:hypothetical protein
MRRRRSITLGLVGVAAVMIGGLLVAANVSAGGQDTLSVGSASVAPGQQGTVRVMADISNALGLGAWTVDVIVENPSQVSIIDCSAPSGSVCNPDYPGDMPTVRFAGATANGLRGSVEIGSITFRCASTQGSSVLSLSTAGFADATVGRPQEIPVTHTPGRISCVSPVVAPTHAAPTPTVVVNGMPKTGLGSSGRDTSALWFAALAAAAVAGLAGLAGLRLRARQP